MPNTADSQATITAVGLVSGGLDSALAVRLVQEQGVRVIGIACTHPFHPTLRPGQTSYPERVARELGIELVRPDVSDAIMAAVQNPPHGYGKHLNPCLDCRIVYLREGEKLRRERGAHFLVTGEVLGQRPMSQRRDALDIIDRDSGLRGLVLRPLSARLLRPTLPEEKGWVDRERLLAVSGRGRKPQLELAQKFGLREYSTPAGGCLLTLDDFARRMKDLMDRGGDIGGSDVELLKHGRHFRLSPAARLVVGKDDSENKLLLALARPDDVVISTRDVPGPLGLVRGLVDEPGLDQACAILARYVKRVQGPVTFRVAGPAGREAVIAAGAMERAEADACMV